MSFHEDRLHETFHTCFARPALTERRRLGPRVLLGSSLVTTAFHLHSQQLPEKQTRAQRPSKDEEIQRGSVPRAEDDGVVFPTIRVTHKGGAAAAADAENALVWITGTLGEKKPPFTSAAW